VDPFYYIIKILLHTFPYFWFKISLTNILKSYYIKHEAIQNKIKIWEKFPKMITKLLFDCSISSIFSTSRITQTLLSQYISQCTLGVWSLSICSCDGILCFTIDHISTLLWNHSIRKLNMLPPLEISQKWFCPFYPFCKVELSPTQILRWNKKSLLSSFCYRITLHMSNMGMKVLILKEWECDSSFPL